MCEYIHINYIQTYTFVNWYLFSGSHITAVTTTVIYNCTFLFSLLSLFLQHMSRVWSEADKTQRKWNNIKQVDKNSLCNLKCKKKCYSHFKESEIEREARRGKCHRLRFSVVSTQLTSICQHKKKCRHEIFPNCFQPFVVVTLHAVLAHLHLLLMCSFVGPNFLLLEIRIRPISIYILYLIQI